MAATDSGYAALDGEQPALIAPGEYELVYLHHETKILFSKPKLYVWFKVLTFGECFEAKVCRYYGVRRLIGKAGKYGRFAIGWKSDFLREYAQLFGLPVRLDRIAMSRFENVRIIGRVRTVESGRNQRQITEVMRYSAVDELLRDPNLQKGLHPIPSPSPLPLPPPT